MYKKITIISECEFRILLFCVTEEPEAGAEPINTEDCAILCPGVPSSHCFEL
jgi:hypothetical protein